MSVLLQPEPLTQEAFAPFGDVLEATDQANHFTINEGFTERYHQLARVDLQGENANGVISIFRSTPLSKNSDNTLSISMMERHPLGSQAFMPLGDQPYLVVVAPKGDFDASQMKVFLANANQGVNYHTGTWHHFCLALNEVSDFLVVDRAGAGNNCDEVTLEPSFTIQLATVES